MGKIRVYELAKQLKVSSKDLVKKMNDNGIDVKNHMSSVEQTDADKILSLYSPKKEEVKQEKPQKSNNEVDSKNNFRKREYVNNKNVQKPREKVDDKAITQKPRSVGTYSGNRPQRDSVNGNFNNRNRNSFNKSSNSTGNSFNRNLDRRQTGTNVNKGPVSRQNNTGFNKLSIPKRNGVQVGNSQNNNNKNTRNAKELYKKNQKNISEQRNGLKKNQEKVKPQAVNKKRKKEKVNDKKSEKLNENVQTTSDIITVKLPKSIILKDLAEKINKPIAEIIKVLLLDGLMVNQNQVVDFAVASRLAEKFNVVAEEAEEIDLFADQVAEKSQDEEKDLVVRPPVVVVMGHVDHGKTSLLDAIRHTNVINTEAGGITQHIGAYTVSISGKPITFLDTPGHEAFTAMRMRGAQATDIAILVVAADDGIMPQTVEAINHAKAAGVEIIVAINKIDKPGANVDRVKQELVEHGLVSEDWGGQTVCVPVSAKNNIGIDNLLEMIILVAEMKELKANPNKKANGIVIEAKLDKGRGPIATVLVQGGTLKVGDPVVAGGAYGKVRAMIDDKSNRVKKALPSTPVEILGLSSVPNAGDVFYVAESEKHARQLAESVANKNKIAVAEAASKVSLDDLFSQINKGNVKDLNIIVKADVQGSVEAIKSSLERLSNSEVKIKAIHGGVGAITESDIMLAAASNAIIIGFNVRPEASAKSIADQEKVDVRLYRIIYDAIEDIKAAMKGLLDPIYKEKVIGHAQVRQLFKVSSLGTIAGSYVTDGKVTRNSKIRLIRDGKTVYEGEIGTLRRFKDDVKEVTEGFECGITISKFNDIKENDVFEAYIMEQIQR